MSPYRTVYIAYSTCISDSHKSQRAYRVYCMYTQSKAEPYGLHDQRMYWNPAGRTSSRIAEVSCCTAVPLWMIAVPPLTVSRPVVTASSELASERVRPRSRPVRSARLCVCASAHQISRMPLAAHAHPCCGFMPMRTVTSRSEAPQCALYRMPTRRRHERPTRHPVSRHAGSAASQALMSWCALSRLG